MVRAASIVLSVSAKESMLPIDEELDLFLQTKFRSPEMPPRVPPKMPAKTKPLRSVKTFKREAWDGAGEGEKIVMYGASGRGKTTCASLAPDPIFIGLDDGGRKIRNPITGEPIQRIAGIETFQDVLDALLQESLFVGIKSIVIDTGTMLELLAIQWVLDNVPHEKGKKIQRLEDYGYGKGYTHLFDAMRMVLQSFDTHVRKGRNIILLCQQCPMVIANPEGANFLENGPKLYAPGPESKQTFTIRGYVCEWADHVLKLDYAQQQVHGDRVDAETGKQYAGKVVGSTERVIFTTPADPSYFAKTRTLAEPIISFETKDDNSLWQYLFPEHYEETG